MPITDSALADLINTTREALPIEDISIAASRQKFEIVNRILPQHKRLIKGGSRLADRVILDRTGNAKHVALFEENKLKIADIFSALSLYWVHATGHYAFERREDLMNVTPERMVDLVKARRVEAQVGLAEEIEAKGWLAPSAAETNVNPFGPKYWVNALADGQAGAGFYGCLPSGFTTVGGIVPSTSGENTTSPVGGKPLWRNWAAGGTGYYTGVVDDVCVNSLDQMLLNIVLESPEIADDLKMERVANHRLYLNQTTLLNYKKWARQNNDQVGPDLGEFAGRPAFNRIPLTWVPDLDADTRNPIYAVNWNHAYLAVKEGDYLYEHPAMNTRDMPNVFVVTMDLTYQFLFRSRQHQGIMRATA